MVMVGQPAEETASGAAAMLRAGLFTKFPRPDYVLALHDSAVMPAGTVGWHEGPMLAGLDSVDITMRGFGGHGGAPHMTKDPIMIASELVVFFADCSQPRNGFAATRSGYGGILPRGNQAQHHP